MKKRVFTLALILIMICLSLFSGCNEESHTPSPAPIPSASGSPAPNPTSSVSGDDQSVPTTPPPSQNPMPSASPSPTSRPNQGGTSTPGTGTPSSPQLPANPPSASPEPPDTLNPVQPDTETPQDPPTTPPEDSDQAPDDQAPNTEESVIFLKVGNAKLSVELFQNSSTRALVELLKSGDISYVAQDYGGFEKVGSLGQSLPTSNSQITAVSGDVILYSGNQIVIFYGSNTWSYTRLGKIKGYSSSQLKDILSGSNVEITISLKE